MVSLKLNDTLLQSIVIGFVFSFLAACSSTPVRKNSSQHVRAVPSPKPASSGKWEPAPQGGGYYLDDGPGELRPSDLADLPSAIPVIEPLAKPTLRPYTVMGQTFAPQTTLEEPYKEMGYASWYGRKFHGAKTANGEIYDMYQMTAAHPTLPLPCYAKVTNLDNGKFVIVRVNDRGPFLRSRIIDLSYAAAFQLGYIGHGSTQVIVEKMTPEIIAQYNAESNPPVLAQNNKMPFIAPQSGQNNNKSQLTTVSAASPISPLLSVASRPSLAPLGPSNRPVYLQIGAFGQEANAQAMKKNVFNNSEQLGMSTKILSEAGLHRVLVGPFASLDQANDAAIELTASIAIIPVIKEDLILP